MYEEIEGATQQGEFLLLSLYSVEEYITKQKIKKT